MKTVITKGLTGRDLEEMEMAFKSSARIRERISKIILERIDSSHKKSVSTEEYDSPNWAYKQADQVGYERALREIISILES